VGYQIPEEGKLASNDIGPFFAWHKEVFEYEDGTVVDAESLGTTAGSKVTGPNSNKSSTDYDGTTIRWRVSD
jgi:hypothetical protein